MIHDALTVGSLSGEFTDGIGNNGPDGKVDLGYDWSSFFDKEDRPRRSTKGALCSISDDAVKDDPGWKEAQKSCDGKFVNVDLGRRAIQRRYELVIEDIATSSECSPKKSNILNL
ncbi:hypothetical protein HZA40_05075 [Candidatus Peregrinibacteria bacterium]|nr:hypothetical protein [Candidatus Peregrinibacteria bacterium]